MDLETFRRLEEALEKLLQSHGALKEEKRLLTERLREKESEIEGLKERLEKLDSEKELIRDKVDGLLNKLEGFI
ncbi:MAG TPA: hypothetical protein ENJ37_02950 [Deltaproteobacteria bacterium]|nr:hypothetical protein [Deltaproteobacteria bacterium]